MEMLGAVILVRGLLKVSRNKRGAALSMGQCVECVFRQCWLLAVHFGFIARVITMCHHINQCTSI